VSVVLDSGTWHSAVVYSNMEAPTAWRTASPTRVQLDGGGGKLGSGEDGRGAGQRQLGAMVLVAWLDNGASSGGLRPW
jgi:hypothetical protein